MDSPTFIDDAWRGIQRMNCRARRASTARARSRRTGEAAGAWANRARSRGSLVTRNARPYDLPDAHRVDRLRRARLPSCACEHWKPGSTVPAVRLRTRHRATSERTRGRWRGDARDVRVPRRAPPRVPCELECPGTAPEHCGNRVSPRAVGRDVRVHDRGGTDKRSSGVHQTGDHLDR